MEPPSGPPGPLFGPPGPSPLRTPSLRSSECARTAGRHALRQRPARAFGATERARGLRAGRRRPRPQPGELHLRGRRSWKTWHVAIFVLIACLLGMWFAWLVNGSASSATSGSGTGGTYKLPPQSGSGSSTTTVQGSPEDRAASRRRLRGAQALRLRAGAAGSSSDHDDRRRCGELRLFHLHDPAPRPGVVPGSCPSGSGNWTSPAFTVAGSTWYIGWAYQCNPVPAARPTLRGLRGAERREPFRHTGSVEPARRGNR